MALGEKGMGLRKGAEEKLKEGQDRIPYEEGVWKETGMGSWDSREEIDEITEGMDGKLKARRDRVL